VHLEREKLLIVSGNKTKVTRGRCWKKQDLAKIDLPSGFYEGKEQWANLSGKSLRRDDSKARVQLNKGQHWERYIDGASCNNVG